MSAPRFAVEAISGNIGILTSHPDLVAPILAEGEKQNLEFSVFTPPDLVASLARSFPTPDSWLIFLTPSLGSFFIGEGRGVWSALTTHPHPHLYLVERAWEPVPLELPSRSTRLLLGEYLGLDHAGAPTLTALQSALNDTHACTLGEGGLTPLHLMSETYLVQGILRVITSQSEAPKLNLGNPHGVSLLTLAQLYGETHKISLEINYQASGLTSRVPVSFYRATHTMFETLPKESTLDLFLAQLKLAVPARPPLPPPKPPAPPRPPATKPKLPVLKRSDPTPPLTSPRALNLSNLEFVPRPAPGSRSLLRPPRFLKHQSFRIVAKGLLFGFIFYLGSLALSLGITFVTLRSFQAQLASGQLEGLRPNRATSLAAQYLYANSSALGLRDLAALLDAYQQALTLSSTTANLARESRAIASHLLTETEHNLASSLTTARLEVENLYQQLSLFDAALPATLPSFLSASASDYQAVKDLLPVLKKNTLLSKGVLSILPELIGLNDRTKYLVLFQNNMELRATGGFIGSYGLLSFEKGKLYDFQVYDVYTADGALKGHVEPPAPIKNILGEAKWYLRDSNFDPDFPTSARRAEWFLKKSMNQDVDGTLAVNLETLRALLSVVGPLELPDYQETITASNLAERAQFHAEVNFFPGSTAKKEFLSSVSNALFAKLKTADSGTLLALSAALLQTLESNDTQLSVISPTSEKILQTLGWNGALEAKPCPATPCYDDYLYSVDSNFGVNKANFYLTKDLALNVAVDKEGLPTYTLQTTWKNAATSNAWPAGAYKNYARLYLPLSVNLQSVVIDSRPLDPTAYTLTEEHGRLVLSYLVTVPTNSVLTSTVTYTAATPLKSGSLYSLYFQRQSGSRPEDKLSVTYNLPLYLKPTKLSPEPAVLEPQQLRFDLTAATDRRLSIQF